MVRLRKRTEISPCIYTHSGLSPCDQLGKSCVCGISEYITSVAKSETGLALVAVEVGEVVHTGNGPGQSLSYFPVSTAGPLGDGSITLPSFHFLPVETWDLALFHPELGGQRLFIIATLEKEGNPLQYSCLENPMDRGSWWATVHGVIKSQM